MSSQESNYNIHQECSTSSAYVCGQAEFFCGHCSSCIDVLSEDTRAYQESQYNYMHQVSDTSNTCVCCSTELFCGYCSVCTDPLPEWSHTSQYGLTNQDDFPPTLGDEALEIPYYATDDVNNENNEIPLIEIEEDASSIPEEVKLLNSLDEKVDMLSFFLKTTAPLGKNHLPSKYHELLKEAESILDKL